MDKHFLLKGALLFSTLLSTQGVVAASSYEVQVKAQAAEFLQREFLQRLNSKPLLAGELTISDHQGRLLERSSFYTSNNSFFQGEEKILMLNAKDEYLTLRFNREGKFDLYAIRGHAAGEASQITDQHYQLPLSSSHSGISFTEESVGNLRHTTRLRFEQVKIPALRNTTDEIILDGELTLIDPLTVDFPTLLLAHPFGGLAHLEQTVGLQESAEEFTLLQKTVLTIDTYIGPGRGRNNGIEFCFITVPYTALLHFPKEKLSAAYAEILTIGQGEEGCERAQW